MFDRVIVGVDGRQGGHDAIALARRLAAPGARVIFAHVYSVPTAAGRAGALALPLQLEAAEQLVGAEARRYGLMAEPAAIYGSSVARGLHQLAEERRADLLILGSCHRGLLSRTLLGSDTRAALDDAPCAVAIAPRGYANDSPPTLRLSRIGVGCDIPAQGAAALLVARSLARRHGAFVQKLTVESTDNDPGQELASESADLDMLILGSGERGRVGRVRPGSTAIFLARHSRCPVVVLPRSVDERRLRPDPQATLTRS